MKDSPKFPAFKISLSWSLGSPRSAENSLFFKTFYSEQILWFETSSFAQATKFAVLHHTNLAKISQILSSFIFVSFSRVENSGTKLSELKRNWEIGVLGHLSSIQGLRNKNFEQKKSVSSEKCFCTTERELISHFVSLFLSPENETKLRRWVFNFHCPK